MAFRGWPPEALDFYEGLEADNSKTYWTEHKKVYEDQVLAPMRELLAEIEEEFGGGRVYRPYRDVRFSADKSPYKTSIAASLDGGGFVMLSARGLGVGNGWYMMDTGQLARYRRAVDDESTGAALREIVTAVEAGNASVTGHDKLKTVPRGFLRDHPRADLLRLKGLVAWKEWSPAAWLGRRAAKDRVVAFLRASTPLMRWLDENVGRASS
jgi:uncharacterized protein (TIGR02453 family)